MAKRICFSFYVEIADKAHPEQIGNAIFDFLASDPDDLFPQIEVVEGWEAKWGATQSQPQWSWSSLPLRSPPESDG